MFQTRRRKPDETRPLIVFIHVPKTAGSTVNRILAAARPGLEHCEAIIGQPEVLRRKLSDLDWISGHVPFDRMHAALRQATDRPLRFFTAVRDPIAQVASHYNWLIEIHHRGKAFYRDHPDHIRVISERIRASDNTDPAAIIENLDRYQGLFLNQQSLTVLGARFNWSSGQLPRHLRAYDYIATERTLPTLIGRLAGPLAERPPRENVSPYHFDVSIFRQGPVRNFLMRNNFLDWTLYRALADRHVRAAIAPRMVRDMAERERT